MNTIEKEAREANSPDVWNRLWEEEGLETWRGDALEEVYDRIVSLLPADSKVVDVGGGVGLLAQRLATVKRCVPIVWDISSEAVATARSTGLEAKEVDVESDDYILPPDHIIVCTECLEHLSEEARDRLLRNLATNGSGKAFFTVPNDRLGHDEEPQHTVKFTAIEFKRYLEQYFVDVRVEVLGYPSNPRGQPAFLLGVCGFPKKTKLSVCFPARDEAADIEKTLASFRGVADEMVIGIDPRTVDNTRELAEKYAEVVFTLKEPKGAGEEIVKAENGVHFSWIRNQCIEKCSNEWFFMTEAHESLQAGHDSLINFELPENAKAAKVVQVIRVGGPPGWRQQWAFPWMARKDPKIYYKRATHNTLEFPENALVLSLPQVRTLHDRVHENHLQRAEQRKAQNRISLMDDWLRNGNQNSLYYLGSEWREHDEALANKGVKSDRAVRFLKEYLAVNRDNGALRYHTRLVLAKLLGDRGEIKEAKQILHGATGDDWSRIDHWVWLGDLATIEERYEEAIQFYLYATTAMGRVPITSWWIDLPYYTWIPPQRLAQAYDAIGNLELSLLWARKAVFWMKSESLPSEMIEEGESNIRLIEEALGYGSSQGHS